MFTPVKYKSIIVTDTGFIDLDNLTGVSIENMELVPESGVISESNKVHVGFDSTDLHIPIFPESSRTFSPQGSFYITGQKLYYDTKGNRTLIITSQIQSIESL